MSERIPRSCPAARGRRTGWVLATIISIGLEVASVHAVGTDPTLALTSATATAAPGGAVSITVDGTFSFDDVVQFSFPAGLIVFRGSNFVVYDIDGSVESGTSPSVANGINAAEVPALLAGDVAASSPAALLRVQSDRITVALPSGFGSGAASVLVFAILEGEPFVSNTVGVILP